MFNWELVIRDHSDDLDQLWGRIHGFRWCINPRRTRGGQLGREKQRDESVKECEMSGRASFFHSFFQFRRAFPASLGLPGPQGRRHIEKREDLEEEVGRRLSAWRKQNQAFCWNLLEQEHIAGNRL